jgi:hypothetical protein
VSIRRRLQALERRIEGPVIICLVWPELDEEGQKWRVAPDGTRVRIIQLHWPEEEPSGRAQPVDRSRR